MSVSMSTCRAQSDSMQKNPMLVALGKDEMILKKKGGDGMTIRGGRSGGEDEGRGMRGSQS